MTSLRVAWWHSGVVGLVIWRLRLLFSVTLHLSVTSVTRQYDRKLGDKQAHHTTHWPYAYVLAALAGVRLKA